MFLKYFGLTVGACLVVYSASIQFSDAHNRQKYDDSMRIRVVGSSTVFPFSTLAAEYFGKKTGYQTPIVEATGTGGGIQAFCAGVGFSTPDMVNASRAMKPVERELCKNNGVKDIFEIPLGQDGLVIAGARNPKGIFLDITKEQIFLALAPQIPQNGKLVPNPYQRWSDIDKNLPNRKIKVLGPPPTSGTRDSFVEMVMEEGCKTVKGAAELGLTGQSCRTIREDGHWQDMGENDNLIVQKINADPDNVGLFGFAYYEENKQVLRAALIDKVDPTFATIIDGTYKISRPLYVYVKVKHFAIKQGLEVFAKEFISDDASREFGYLPERGLIPISAARRDIVRSNITKVAG